MSLQESGEMYLETILLLSKKKNLVRAIDVAEEMGFSKPSVSRALTRLRESLFDDCRLTGMHLFRSGKGLKKDFLLSLKKTDEPGEPVTVAVSNEISATARVAAGPWAPSVVNSTVSE